MPRKLSRKQRIAVVTVVIVVVVFVVLRAANLI